MYCSNTYPGCHSQNVKKHLEGFPEDIFQFPWKKRGLKLAVNISVSTLLIQGDSKMTMKGNFSITHAATEAPINAAQILHNMLGQIQLMHNYWDCNNPVDTNAMETVYLKPL